MESGKGKDPCHATGWQRAIRRAPESNMYVCDHQCDVDIAFPQSLPNECLDVTFSDEDSIELLLPRPSGPGVFSYALVAHLVYAHNEFVDKCSEIVKRPSDYEWRHVHQWYGCTITIRLLCMRTGGSKLYVSRIFSHLI